MAYMTPEAIAEYSPDRLPSSNAETMDRVTRTLARLNLAGPNQQSGQRWTIGCMALEITQRCNLDCTLCYLSENSEAVQDLPIEEIFRRRIADRFAQQISAVCLKSSLKFRRVCNSRKLADAVRVSKCTVRFY